MNVQVFVCFFFWLPEKNSCEKLYKTHHAKPQQKKMKALTKGFIYGKAKLPGFNTAAFYGAKHEQDWYDSNGIETRVSEGSTVTNIDFDKQFNFFFFWFHIFEKQKTQFSFFFLFFFLKNT